MTYLPNPYRAAGTFSGPSYTERQADRDLLRALFQNQRYPYVLAPRQSGKSSLITNIRKQLRSPEFASAFVDFSIFGKRETTTLDAFQTRFFEDCQRSLSLPSQSPGCERFLDGIEQLLRRCSDGRLVIFLDEVDALLPSPFKDTFFSILRNVFNERAMRPELERVQFVLAGAARPEELISDRLRSPFNVGESIVLRDFSLAETTQTCISLAELVAVRPEELAKPIFHYAAGSVYLTQLILETLWNRMTCKVRTRISATQLKHEIRTIADGIVAGASRDIHFGNIRAALLSRKEAVRVFRNALSTGDLSSAERELLWFTGITAREGRGLYRNRIYEQVFTAEGPVDLVTELREIPNNLPRPQPFFGREAELQKIAESLAPESRNWGAIIDGPGGIGKTALAIRAAELAPADRFKRIIFLSSKERELTTEGQRTLGHFVLPSYLEMLNAIARELEQPQLAKSLETERSDAILRALREADVLLVLDNLETLPEIDRDQLFAFLNRLPHGCSAIVTSRRRADASAVAVRLDKLDWPAAQDLLTELAKNNAKLARTTETERRALYKETGGNPLLIRWVVGQLGLGRCKTVDTALEFLRSAPAGNNPLEFIFGDLVDTFSENEIRILAALSYFTVPMPSKLIAELAELNEVAAKGALSNLSSRALVLPDPDERNFALVPKVADFLRKKKPEVLGVTGARLEESAFALIVENGYHRYDRFPILEAAWPIVTAALSLFLAGPNPRLQTVCDALRDFLEFTGRWDEWLSLNQQAEARAVTAGDFAKAGWRAYSIGHIHSLRRQADVVLASAERAALHWEAAKAGPRERAIAIQLRGIGHRLKEDYPAAITAYRESLDLDRSLSPGSQDVAIDLSNLATAEQLSGDLAAAERNYRDALRVATAIGFVEGMVTIIGNLAGLALRRGDWRETEAHARDALSLAEKMGRQELIAFDCLRLAQALLGQHKASEALPFARRAVEIYSKLRSPGESEARMALALSQI